ncbi:MAG: ketopantoate reductase family protein [Halodesulfurarchaeum sp.]|nr:ketopantoate reductase family protein [Halodesulfurarchaeum sp.]
MHVAVIGAGAIGSALAAHLSRANPVTLVGHDNSHLHALETGPLTVREVDGSVTSMQVDVTTDHADVAAADLLVLTVKSYDTDEALLDVEPSLEKTPVLTLQNGLGNIERIRESVAPEQVIGGTTTLGAFVPEPGTVRIESSGETVIGRPWGDRDRVLEQVAETFQSAGLQTEIDARIRRQIWQKVLVNVGINPVTALGGVQNGCLQSGPGRSLLVSAIEEARNVSEAEGFVIDSPVERALAVVEATGENRSSMLRDLESNSKTEIDALNGAIVDRAVEHDILVPVNRTLTDAIKLRSGRGQTP